MRAVWVNRRRWAVAMLACALFLARKGWTADGDSSLTAQLSKHYKLAKAELAANSAAAIGPGGVWSVRMEGIVGFGEADQAMEDLCPATYSGDTLHPNASPLCRLTSAHGRRALRIDDPVCITRISTSSANESVTMYLITCEPGKPTLASHAYYAKLIFRFPNGFLRKATADGVVETVSKVLASSDAAPTPPVTAKMNKVAGKAGESGEEAVTGPEKAPTTSPMAPIPPPPPPGDAQAKTNAADPPAEGRPSKTEPAAVTPAGTPAAAESPTESSAQDKVAKGDPPEKVQAALGSPTRIADLGKRLIYFYPTMKIFFVDGKVSEIQKLDDKDVRGERDARNDKATDPND